MNKLSNAVKDVEECKLAYQERSDSLQEITSDLQASVRPLSIFLLARTPFSSIANTWNTATVMVSEEKNASFAIRRDTGQRTTLLLKD